MPENQHWLTKQRASGGTSWSSTMLRMTANTCDYVLHIADVVGRQRGLLLRVEESIYGYEIRVEDQIVWFGRNIDVELLRATSVTEFEDYLHQRLDRLDELKLINDKTD